MAVGAKGRAKATATMFGSFCALDPHRVVFTDAWSGRWTVWHAVGHSKGRDDKHMASGIIPTANMYVGLCLCASPSVTSPLSVGQRLQVASKVTRHLVVETKLGHMPPRLREAVLSVKQAYVWNKSWCCAGWLVGTCCLYLRAYGVVTVHNGNGKEMFSSLHQEGKSKSTPRFLFMVGDLI